MTRVAALLAILALAGCGPRVADYSIGFNALQDSPDVYVMDYRFGESRQPGARNVHLQRDQGMSPQGTSSGGPMLLVDDLYVKWRVKATGEILHDTVDLRRRLPADLRDQLLYFIVRGRQLYVYLIHRSERRPPGEPPIGSRIYDHLKAVRIYPDPPR